MVRQSLFSEISRILLLCKLRIRQVNSVMAGSSAATCMYGTARPGRTSARSWGQKAPLDRQARLARLDPEGLAASLSERHRQRQKKASFGSTLQAKFSIGI